MALPNTKRVITLHGDKDGIMMATLFGNVQEYDSEKEEWSQYAERLEHFFLANGVVNAEHKRAILLSVMVPACYRLLRSLVAPEKPLEKTYKELVDALKQHHEPKPSEIVHSTPEFVSQGNPFRCSYRSGACWPTSVHHFRPCSGTGSCVESTTHACSS